MPWPMVHFAIASELLSNPTPEFIVGSLAPDSIHVRTNERAEKAKTHLMPETARFATDEELRAFFNSNKKRAQSEPKFMQYCSGTSPMYIRIVYGLSRFILHMKFIRVDEVFIRRMLRSWNL